MQPDRCAREIVRILALSGAARSRRLMRNSLGGWGNVAGNLFCDGDETGAILERASCRFRRAGARCAGVVRRPVVRRARRATRDRVLRVVLITARGAGVLACWRGTCMPAAAERGWPARPTRRSSRPLRARDRCFLEGFTQRACGS